MTKDVFHRDIVELYQFKEHLFERVELSDRKTFFTFKAPAHQADAYRTIVIAQSVDTEFVRLDDIVLIEIPAAFDRTIECRQLLTRRGPAIHNHEMITDVRPATSIRRGVGVPFSDLARSAPVAVGAMDDDAVDGLRHINLLVFLRCSFHDHARSLWSSHQILHDLVLLVLRDVFVMTYHERHCLLHYRHGRHQLLRDNMISAVVSQR